MASTSTELRSTRVPLRFSVGDVRLGAIEIAVKEMTGHFLEQPITLQDLLTSHERERECTLFGRSVLLDRSDKTLFQDRRVRLLIEYPRYYVDLSGSFDEYLARFSSKSRSTLLRKVRKLETLSDGRIDWSTFRSPTDVAPFLDEAVPFSQGTYQHRLFKSGLPAGEPFRQHVESLAARDQFRGWILRIGGAPVAYICALGVGRTLQYDYVGFDASTGQLSPGTVLQYLVLRQLFEEGAFRYFDFTEGAGDHKAFFSTHHADCADVMVLGSTFHTRAMVTLHSGFMRGVRVIANAASPAMKARVRKILRRG